MTFKKKVAFSFWITIFIMVIAVICTDRQITGNQIFRNIPLEDTYYIRIHRTKESKDRLQNKGNVILSKAEVERFYETFRFAKFRDIHSKPLPVDTSIRYYVSFFDKDDIVKGEMKFYGEKYMIFNYIYDDRPAFNEKYMIMSSTFNDFFGKIFEEKNKG